MCHPVLTHSARPDSSSKGNYYFVCKSNGFSIRLTPVLHSRRFVFIYLFPSKDFPCVVSLNLIKLINTTKVCSPCVRPILVSKKKEYNPCYWIKRHKHPGQTTPNKKGLIQEKNSKRDGPVSLMVFFLFCLSIRSHFVSNVGNK